MTPPVDCGGEEAVETGFLSFLFTVDGDWGLDSGMTSASHQSVWHGPESHWLPSGRPTERPGLLFLDLLFHPPTDPHPGVHGPSQAC